MGILNWILTDVDFFFPRAYVNWNKVHNHPEKCKDQGSKKLHMVIDKLEEMELESPTMAGVKKLYDTQPEICW